MRVFLILYCLGADADFSEFLLIQCSSFLEAEKLCLRFWKNQTKHFRTLVSWDRFGDIFSQVKASLLMKPLETLKHVSESTAH